MRWLAKLEIDCETARRQKLFDNYAWHRKLWDCFPGNSEKKRLELGFLTRVDELENRFCCWILSKTKPEKPEWCSDINFSMKEIPKSFLSHQLYIFDVVANPIKAKVKRDENNEPLYRYDENGNILLRPNGKPKRRHSKKIPITQLEELRAWLNKKGEQGGFKVCDNPSLRILQYQTKPFRKKGSNGLPNQIAYHAAVQFRGVLKVTDHEQFTSTYQTGIGSAKGFGFGLLLLAPYQINQ